MSKRTLTIAFASAVLLQVLVLGIVPARQAQLRASGRSIMLDVVPVDPYDVLTGYHVTLGYEISRRQAFPDPPDLQIGQEVFAVLEQGEEGQWRPLRLDTVVPTDLSDQQIVLQGEYRRLRGIHYGIEAFFIPETERAELELRIRDLPKDVRAEIAVDPAGQAALVRLHVGERSYD